MLSDAVVTVRKNRFLVIERRVDLLMGEEDFALGVVLGLHHPAEIVAFGWDEALVALRALVAIVVVHRDERVMELAGRYRLEVHHKMLS